MKKYDKSAVMKKAWSVYKNCRMGGYAACTYPTFAECLKDAWESAKRQVAVDEEAKKYFEEVCKPVIAKGEDAVDEARDEYRRKHARTDSVDIYRAHMKAWEATVSVFRSIMPTWSTEIVDSSILSEIQNLEVA